jgi:hypothetical protein
MADTPTAASARLALEQLETALTWAPNYGGHYREHAETLRAYLAIAEKAVEDAERLRRMLDSRPAINAGLPGTYIEWSQGIYLCDFLAVRGHDDAEIPTPTREAD